MKLEDAEKIVAVNSDIELRMDYSGRGMMGRTTVAIVGSYLDIADAANECGVNLSTMRQDSMGKSDGVIY